MPKRARSQNLSWKRLLTLAVLLSFSLAGHVGWSLSVQRSEASRTRLEQTWPERSPLQDLTGLPAAGSPWLDFTPAVSANPASLRLPDLAVPDPRRAALAVRCKACISHQSPEEPSLLS